MQKQIIPFSLWRRLSQAACLFLFLFLFIKTDYSGSDQLNYAVNILFRLDPLLGACAILAVKTFISLVLPSLFLVGLSLLLEQGRTPYEYPSMMPPLVFPEGLPTSSGPVVGLFLGSCCYSP